MRTKDENKRIAIRNATIEEVVAGGLAGATIARIADRVKLSQGTIYLYYPTKEALIRQVYVEVKLDMRDTLMACFDETASSAENIRTLSMATGFPTTTEDRVTPLCSCMVWQTKKLICGNSR